MKSKFFKRKNMSYFNFFKRTIVSLFLVSLTVTATIQKDSFLRQLLASGLWQEKSPLRLHLGCGENHLEGYINIDYPMIEHTVQQSSGADISADLTTLILDEQSVDEIRSHHVFEHFDRQTALALLCSWHRALKIGGTLIIETPDFEESAKLVLFNKELSYQEKQAIMRHIFGSHEAHWAIHCDGWYQEKFDHILSLLGFEQISISHSRYLNLYNITVEAHKKQPQEKEVLIQKAKAILTESLVANVEVKMYQVWCNKLDTLCSLIP